MLSVAVEGRPTELVAVEHPFPEPLAAKRPVTAPLAVALVLAPVSDEGGDGPVIRMAGASEGPASEPRMTGLRDLWAGVSAGRAIPLLEALGTSGSVVVEAGRGYFMALEVEAP